MATYSNYEQFMTTDGLDFVTSDDNDYLVKIGLHSGDEYFEDTTNRQENINVISFGSYTFGGSKIKSLKLHFESGLLTDQLAIDTMTAEIISDTRPELTRYTPITISRDSQTMGVFFNGTVKEVGKQRYSIYAESYISLLDYDYHYGGVYTGETAGTIVAELMGSIPYTINTDVAAIKLYGYLPYATKRENLLQILIATGAAIERNSSGTINLGVTTDASVGTFGDERVFIDGSLNEETQVTAAQVTEHSRVATTEETTLLEETFTDTRLITFPEPYHDLVCTNGTILASGANYANIQGSGDVVLTGQKYRHTTRIVTKGTISGTPDDKIISVTNATLVTGVNSSSVAQRLYKYASCNKSIKQDVLINQERTGKMVQIVHPYGDDYLSAAVQSFDFNLSNTLRAAGNFSVGYVPQGISAGYQNRAMITASGSWTVPEGITEVRSVLISGGQGGQGGFDGQNGSQGESVWDDDYTIYNGGAGGDGGAGGTQGLPGKIFIVTIPVTPGQIIPVSPGTGGAGGLNGSAGQEGAATTFGGSSSASGAMQTDGYVDIFTSETYASDNGIPGIPGVAGGDGSRIGTGSAGDNTDTGAGGIGGSGYSSTSGDDKSGGGGGGGAGSNANGGAGGDATLVDRDMTSGSGGSGASPSAPTQRPSYGFGGNGGHGGGGGGGAGGYKYLDNDHSYSHQQGDIGAKGIGSYGGTGAPGCAIIYY